MSWKTILGVALMVLGSGVAEAKTDLWLHIKVRDGEDGSRVNINLPLAVVEAAMPMIPEDARHAGRMRVNDRDLSVADLRRIWRAVQQQPEATFVTVESAEDHVRVAKSGKYLLIDSTNHGDRGEAGERHHLGHAGEQVQVRIPVTVVDALLAGGDDHFDLAAALTALARNGEGEIVTVDGKNETVRMWVDSEAEGR